MTVYGKVLFKGIAAVFFHGEWVLPINQMCQILKLVALPHHLPGENHGNQPLGAAAGRAQLADLLASPLLRSPHALAVTAFCRMLAEQGER